MTRAFAPIALFAYRRPDHLQKTLAALMACPEFERSDVFIYSDGPRNHNAQADVEAVRLFLKGITAPNIKVIEAEHNRGLAASTIAGVSELTAAYGRAIAMEDDLVVHPSTLTWFNAALERYRDNPSVFHVSCGQWRIPEFERRTDGMLLPFINSWGWATWKDRWDLFDPRCEGWEQLNSDPLLSYRFDQDGQFPLTDMLQKQMRGRIDSWAIRWWWTVFRHNGLGVFPPRSLVTNIGWGAKASHNHVGLLKKFFEPPRSRPWRQDAPPSLGPAQSAAPADIKALQRGLRRTGALRNLKIKRLLGPLLPKGMR